MLDTERENHSTRDFYLISLLLFYFSSFKIYHSPKMYNPAFTSTSHIYLDPWKSNQNLAIFFFLNCPLPIEKRLEAEKVCCLGQSSFQTHKEISHTIAFDE